jgi:hypothetical protein
LAEEAAAAAAVAAAVVAEGKLSVGSDVSEWDTLTAPAPAVCEFELEYGELLSCATKAFA